MKVQSHQPQFLCQTQKWDRTRRHPRENSMAAGHSFGRGAHSAPVPGASHGKDRTRNQGLVAESPASELENCFDAT